MKNPLACLKKNFKKNVPIGVVGLAMIIVIYILLKIVISPLSEILYPIYKLIPISIKPKILDNLIFFLSSLIFIVLFLWASGALLSVEHKGKSLAAFLSALPIVGSFWKSFLRFKTVVGALRKYGMVVRWEPHPKFVQYGVVTNKVKITKKFPDGRTQIKEKFILYVGTVPLELTGNIIEPDPKDIWLVKNLTFTQLFRLMATAGADMPEELILEPILERYPDFEIERIDIGNNNQERK